MVGSDRLYLIIYWLSTTLLSFSEFGNKHAFRLIAVLYLYSSRNAPRGIAKQSPDCACESFLAMTWPLPSRFLLHRKIPRQTGAVEFYCQDFGNFDVSHKLINSLRMALGAFCALGSAPIRVELDIQSPQILQLFQGETHFGGGEAHVVVAIFSSRKPQADIEFQSPDSALLHRG